MANPKNLGVALAGDDEVEALKPRAKSTTKVEVEAAAPVAAVVAAPEPERMVRIVLEENENIPPTGQFISVNGRSFMLRPGDEANVPMCVIHVLNDAVQDVPQLDQATRQIVGYRKKLRFPYRVLSNAVMA